ncbi:MAG: hypothetical protein DHS20C15_32010 [Planctomycetota bacterium]|nr:MAG: hypothetical protein DHS20C15_32010 [Planctomycetota bacterium]
MGNWEHVRELFESALDVEPAARTALLDRRCSGDVELRREVERLLELHRDDEFLHAPEASARRDLLSAPLARLDVGSDFAGFEILGLLGSGGMGAVYEARQREPSRRVALKVLRDAAPSEQAVARFRWEAELLARLRHPGIAQVYAAGVEREGGAGLGGGVELGGGAELGGGVPWFALELVEGALPITEFVRAGGVDRDAALALFCAACDAVQHGHNHGVIHRDLKPANVLVDDEARVKLIDFGVAQLANDDGLTRLTRAGDLVGTFGTMSPEQLEGASDQVDARADVYALGAVLHELLCGAPLHDLRGCSLTEIARRVRHERPSRPSEVRPGVSEELDWIVTRAVEHDPARRYASASELAADVRRFRAREPVLAGPVSSAYLLRSFVRRHRAGVVATTAVLLALLGGLVSTTVWMWRAEESAQAARAQAELAEEQRLLAAQQSLRAEEQRVIAESERARAERESASSRAVADFVVGLIRSPDPALDGKEVRVVDVLARADEQLERSLVDQPGIAATLHATLGRLHYNLGLLDEAEAQLATALALTPLDDAAQRNEHLAARASLGVVRRDAGDLIGAEADLLAVLAARRTQLGADHEDTASTLAELAGLRRAQGRMGEAGELYVAALSVLRDRLGPDHERVLRVEANLAALDLARRRHVEAAERLTEVVPRMREHLGRRHPATLTALANLASLRVFTGQLDEGARLLDEVMRGHREILPAGHPSLLADLSNLSVLRLQLGEFDEAVRLCSEVIATRSADAPLAPDVILMRCNLTHMLHAAGNETRLDQELEALLALDLANTLEQPGALAYVENTSRDVALWGRGEQALALTQAGIDGRARLAPDDLEGRFAARRAHLLARAILGDDVDAELDTLCEIRAQLPTSQHAGLDDALLASFAKDGLTHAALSWRDRCIAGE